MNASALARYTRAANRTAAGMIAEYSTSFGLATRMLPPTTRQHVRNVYALVRLADEVVDGVPRESGLAGGEIAAALEDLEGETERALRTGYSTNLVVHAFAVSARETGIDRELTAPFYASMRMDLHRATHTTDSFAEYVDGSAEVVGLMCLRTFEVGRRRSAADSARLEAGARRLGAAFQKVNFLRDLQADSDGLGRAYFPGVEPGAIDEATKLRLVDDIAADLGAAAAVLPMLDAGPRRAVALAHALFAELNDRIRATPAEVLRSTRIRVPDPVKAGLAARAAAGRLPRRR